MQCQACGAPAVPGHVMCRFCKRPVSAEAADAAISCPQCGTLNIWGSTNCVACSAWVVVQCVFCAQLSPHNQPSCLSCGEAFAGAMERKVQYDNHVRNQQFAHNAGIAGQVAAPFLGAMAGSMVGSFFSGGHHAYAHEHHVYEHGHDSLAGGHVEHTGSADAGDFSSTFSDDSSSDAGGDFGDADAGDFGGVFDE